MCQSQPWRPCARSPGPRQKGAGNPFPDSCCVIFKPFTLLVLVAAAATNCIDKATFRFDCVDARCFVHLPAGLVFQCLIEPVRHDIAAMLHGQLTSYMRSWKHYPERPKMNLTVWGSGRSVSMRCKVATFRVDVHLEELRIDALGIGREGDTNFLQDA